MSNRETLRALSLKRQLEKSGLLLENFRHPEYPAIVLHSNSTIFTGNQSAADLVGCTVEKLTGLNAWTLFPVKSAEILRQKLAERSEHPYQVLARKLCGEEYLMELKGENLMLAGEPIRAISFKRVEPCPG